MSEQQKKIINGLQFTIGKRESELRAATADLNEYADTLTQLNGIKNDLVTDVAKLEKELKAADVADRVGGEMYKHLSDAYGELAKDNKRLRDVLKNVCRSQEIMEARRFAREELETLTPKPKGKTCGDKKTTYIPCTFNGIDKETDNE